MGGKGWLGWSVGVIVAIYNVRVSTDIICLSLWELHSFIWDYSNLLLSRSSLNGRTKHVQWKNLTYKLLPSHPAIRLLNFHDHIYCYLLNGIILLQTFGDNSGIFWISISQMCKLFNPGILSIKEWPLWHRSGFKLETIFE